MTIGEAQKWLPDCAVTGDHALTTVTDCMSRWNDDWFAKKPLAAAPDWRRAGATAGLVFAGRGNGIVIRYRPDPDWSLAGLLLGKKLHAKDVRSKRDSLLLEALVKKALADLLERLTKALPKGGEGDEPAFELPMKTQRGNELIVVSISRAILTDLALEKCPPPRPLGRPARRAEALADQTVRMSALVGRSKLELVDLLEISVGDVLILDRMLGSPMDVMVENRVRGKDSAMLSQDGESLSLSIERSVDQW